jgi:membrane protein implicated in regulation of membrane protease activity
MWWQEWWVWAAVAFGLAIGEILIPGFVLLGFAIGAGVVALILLVLTTISASLGISWIPLVIIFSVVSLVAWIILRRSVGVYRSQVKNFDHDINDEM